MFKLNDPITALEGVGPARSEQLKQLGIITILDLLKWLPRHYLDCTRPSPINALQFGQRAVVLATVKSVSKRRSFKGKVLVSALLEDDTGSIEAIWFNQPFLEAKLKRLKQGLFIGTIKPHYQSRRPILSAPLIESTPAILPVYSLTAGLNSRFLGTLVKAALGKTDVKEELAAGILKRADLIPYPEAIKKVHCPLSMEEVHAGRRRLLFEELLKLQRGLALIRQTRRQYNPYPITLELAWLKQFVKDLPFSLTDDQKKAIWQMAGELTGEGGPMHRLLNGDVGSGKTVVAAALLLLTVKSGYKGVLMAPTEILAHQHVVSLKRFLTPFNITVGLVTAKTKEQEADVLVGTHALLSADINLKTAALTIIDEQHRFGVRQRQLLAEKATANGRAPHSLALSATPIPRSLALALFGDLDVTVIKQLPAGRQPIKTVVVRASQEKEMDQTIREAIKRGEQTYVVCPLIEKVVEDGIVEDERHSVLAVYERLAKGAFSDCKIATLHGKMSSEKKESLLKRFFAGKIDILVSTSVVEVGVDIPNATVMVVESAERFGIAQLHQLRGRVGRGEKPAICYLMIRQLTDTAIDRCQKVASTQDGFELARFDLEQRGPGELVGLAQKGINQLFLGEIDFDLLKQAQEVAREEIGK